MVVVLSDVVETGIRQNLAARRINAEIMCTARVSQTVGNCLRTDVTTHGMRHQHHRAHLGILKRTVDT